MFPTDSSVLLLNCLACCPSSDSSLPYSWALLGKHFPIFRRYYEGAKTSRCHLRRLIVHSPPDTSRGSVLFARNGGRAAPVTPGCWSAGGIPSPASIRRNSRDLPCPQGTFMCLGHTLATPVGRLRLAVLDAFVLSAVKSTQGTPTICHLSRLCRMSSALAVYASCPPRDGLRKTRFGVVANLSPMGLATHKVPIECFRSDLFYVISLPPHSLRFMARQFS